MTSMIATALLTCLIAQEAPAQQAGAATMQQQHLADQHFAMLTEAYGLDANQQGWLRQELDRRLAAAADHDRVRQVLRADLEAAKNQPEKRSQLFKQLLDHTRTRPLDLDEVVKAMTPKLRPEQVAAGSAALPGIRRHGSAVNARPAADEQKASHSSGDKAAAGNTAVAPLQPPLVVPAEPAKFAPRFNGKNPPNVPNKSGGSEPDAGGGNNDAPVVKKTPGGQSSPAMPAMNKVSGPVTLTEWQKLVQDTAAKYKFSESQLGAANAILKDCERRADAYRKVHAANYARVEKLADAKAKTTEKTRLDAPLAAMGQELRDRLEQIPTASQRKLVSPKAPVGKRK